jgi:hypothetical protein
MNHMNGLAVRDHAAKPDERPALMIGFLWALTEGIRCHAREWNFFANRYV